MNSAKLRVSTISQNKNQAEVSRAKRANHIRIASIALRMKLIYTW